MTSPKPVIGYTRRIMQLWVYASILPNDMLHQFESGATEPTHFKWVITGGEVIQESTIKVGSGTFILPEIDLLKYGWTICLFALSG